jgi:protein-S-isoprenylcysteine O-methyltransferase Ste14
MGQSTPTPANLKSKVFIRAFVTLLFTALMLFLPAGSLRYWQAWVLIAIVYIPMIFSTFYFLKRDPALVERRMQSVEEVPEQKHVMRWARVIFLGGFLIPGFDFRFGWSHVPLDLAIISQAVVLVGYLSTYWVFTTNSFASRTIRVEKEQTVISTGPYRFVRHPMYSGVVLMMVFMPPALGSYWALPVFLLIIPLIVFRLLNEEKVLRQELAGYTDYCLRTRFRLVSFLW